MKLGIRKDEQRRNEKRWVGQFIFTLKLKNVDFNNQNFDLFFLLNKTQNVDFFCLTKVKILTYKTQNSDEIWRNEKKTIMLEVSGLVMDFYQNWNKFPSIPVSLFEKKY